MPSSAADRFSWIEEPAVYREPYVFSFRHPRRSFLARFFAHVLIRLLVIAPLPPQLQVAAALFPVSVLWPLLRPAAEPPPEALEEGSPGAATPASGWQGGLSRGSAHLPLRPVNVLAGREGVRGKVGGSEPVTLEVGEARLSVPARALAEDTAIVLETHALSAFLPSATGLTPLAEVFVDFSGQELALGAELSVASALVSPGDTLVVARVERVEGIPRLAVVALGELVGDRIVSRPFPGLPGVAKGGRYVFYRLGGPIGFVAGTTSSSAGPVKAVVSTAALPFIAVSAVNGSYIVGAVPGSTTLMATVPKTSLQGTAQAVVAAKETTPSTSSSRAP